MVKTQRLTDFLNSSVPYLTDGGFETSMLFYEGFDLPEFAAFPIMDEPEGPDAVERYFTGFLEIAKAHGRGFVLDTNTWRAGLAWAEALGLSRQEMLDVNHRSVAWARRLRAKWETRALPIVIDGVVGPAGDAYLADTSMTPLVAEDIHFPQVHALAEAGADLVSAITLTNSAEGIGIVKAAARAEIPVVISFTLETDGHLPTGQALPDAIAEVDAATGAQAIYFMINCAHPDHFSDKLGGNSEWLERIGGVRANASRMSHAELDECEELDDGDPEEFGELHQDLLARLPNLRVFGGCCGTDRRHVGCVSSKFRSHLAA